MSKERGQLMLLLGIVFLHSAYTADYALMLIVAFFHWKYTAKLLGIGGATANADHIRPGRYYTDGTRLLLTTAYSSSWILTRQIQHRANYHTPLGTCIAEARLPLLMVDADQPLPPRLQVSSRPIPRRIPRPLIQAALCAIILGAVWCFTQSNTWRLHHVLSQDTPDIAEAMSLARMTNASQIARVEAHRLSASVNILFHRAPDTPRHAAVLIFELRNGDSICAYFDRKGKLIARKKYAAEP